MENTLERCADGIDNDGNGYIDCNDFGCSRSDDQAIVSMCAERVEDSVETCSDGEDNDQDGYVDCDDFSCSQSENDEVAALCGGDPEATFEACSDGIDNDGNGYTDCADYSCRDAEDPSARQACQESVFRPGTFPAPSPQDIGWANAYCEDGLDNDGDGYIDCADWDCSWNPLVTICQGPRVCEERE